jgi:hypothetical protein
LSITKRGPGQVRKRLYLAALRMVQTQPVVAAWYQGRGAYRREAKRAAIVAVMRKVARALWHIARGGVFEPQKLFDTRRLDLSTISNARPNLMASSRTPPPISPGGAPQPNA